MCKHLNELMWTLLGPRMGISGLRKINGLNRTRQASTCLDEVSPRKRKKLTLFSQEWI